MSDRTITIAAALDQSETITEWAHKFLDAWRDDSVDKTDLLEAVVWSVGESEAEKLIVSLARALEAADDQIGLARSILNETFG